MEFFRVSVFERFRLFSDKTLPGKGGHIQRGRVKSLCFLRMMVSEYSVNFVLCVRLGELVYFVDLCSVRETFLKQDLKTTTAYKSTSLSFRCYKPKIASSRGDSVVQSSSLQ